MIEIPQGIVLGTIFLFVTVEGGDIVVILVIIFQEALLMALRKLVIGFMALWQSHSTFWVKVGILFDAMILFSKLGSLDGREGKCLTFSRALAFVLFVRKSPIATFFL